jgi:hypothetical protein
MPSVVIVATHAHKSGRDIRVFASETAAERWRREIADEWWYCEIGDGVEPPNDPKERADVFWRSANEHRGVWFSMERFEVESDACQEEATV